MMRLMCKVTMFRNFIIVRRAFSSALYVTGDKAQSQYVVLTPHIDFEERIKNKEALERNIKARKLDLDLDKIMKRWDFFKTIDDHKFILDTTRTEIGKMLAKLREEPDKNQSDIDKLSIHLKMVKDDLKNVKEYSYDVEENAHLAVLKLPNVLHPKTPLNEAIQIHSFLDKPSHESKSHLEIGRSENLLDYVNPTLCYLKSEAALFEFAITNYFQSELVDSDFIQFSNADFARSIIIEGCGVDFADSGRVFTLADTHNDKPSDINRLHLVGGASIYAFMCYWARHSVQKSYLPLKIFANGRCYQPTPITNGLENDLIDSGQHSAVHVFIATTENDDILNETFTDMVQKAVKMYEALGFHFRFVYEPAERLKTSESLKLSIQMYSNYRRNYVEIGNLSIYDDYLSKRLRLNYLEGKERKFPKVIAGQLLNVQKLLACLLENNSNNNDPLITDLLKTHF